MSNTVSGLRERTLQALRDVADEAAQGAGAAVKIVGTKVADAAHAVGAQAASLRKSVDSAAEAAKPFLAPAPPAPAPCSQAHCDRGLADFVKNAIAQIVKPKNDSTASFYGEVGFGGSIGIDSTALGGSIASGALVGLKDGESQGFVSTASTSAAVAGSIGAGFEVGYIQNRAAFYGNGEQVVGGVGPFSATVQLTEDGKINAFGVGVGKGRSLGVPFGLVHQFTNTENESGQ